MFFFFVFFFSFSSFLDGRGARVPVASDRGRCRGLFGGDLMRPPERQINININPLHLFVCVLLLSV